MITWNYGNSFFLLLRHIQRQTCWRVSNLFGLTSSYKNSLRYVWRFQKIGLSILNNLFDLCLKQKGKKERESSLTVNTWYCLTYIYQLCSILKPVLTTFYLQPGLSLFYVWWIVLGNHNRSIVLVPNIDNNIWLPITLIYCKRCDQKLFKNQIHYQVKLKWND